MNILFSHEFSNETKSFLKDKFTKKMDSLVNQNKLNKNDAKLGSNEPNVGRSRPYITFIAGGDGTINHYLNELSHDWKNHTFGFWALGSNNSLVKSLTASTTNQLLNTNVTQTLDAIEFKVDGVKAKYFFANSSFGLLAQANFYFQSKVAQKLKKFSISLANTFSFLRALFEHKNFKTGLTINNEKKTIYVAQLQILKGPYFAGQYRFQFQQEPNSGSFHVYGIRSCSRLRLLWIFLRWSLRPNAYQYYDFHYRLNQFTIETEKPVLMEYDGELVHGKSFTFKCLRGALNVCSNSHFEF